MQASTPAHSLGRQLHAALRRSLDVARQETAKVMRFEALQSRAELGRHSLPLYSFTSPPASSAAGSSTSGPASYSPSSSHILPLHQEFATGSDIDIGGLSTVRFGWDPAERAARFWGTLSSDIPRGAKIERSGYAAFRNKNRPTLFGVQTWDTTMHPFLAIRIRNRLGGNPAHPTRSTGAPSSSSSSSATSAESSSSTEQSGLDPDSLRTAVDAAYRRASTSPSDVLAHAIHALGLNLREPPGPRFFVNIQTDGPVTSDLFQHRLFLDPAKLDEWQTIVIPFDSFVLTNTGTVSLSPVSMLREKIRTVGISAVLDLPAIPQSASSSSSASTTSSPSAGPEALRKRAAGEQVDHIDEDDDWARDGNLRSGPSDPSSRPTAVRGSKRGRSFPFDLAIEHVSAVADPEQLKHAEDEEEKW